MHYAGIDYNDWFTFTYGSETRGDPLPRLGAQQLLFRKKGACEDVAALETFIFRSQGIPVAYDFVPLWATSMGAHFMNTVFDTDMNPIRLDVTTGSVVNHKLPREPAKVIRLTYSRQPNTLAELIPLDSIPTGYMRQTNYLDVTNEYWATTDVSLGLYSTEDSAKITYACYFSGGRWQPMWWGKSLSDSVLFSKMPKGTVVLRAYFTGGKLKPAGYCEVLGFNHEVTLKPDFLIDER